MTASIAAPAAAPSVQEPFCFLGCSWPAFFESVGVEELSFTTLLDARSAAFFMSSRSQPGFNFTSAAMLISQAYSIHHE
jgi:hypothetical protein